MLRNLLSTNVSIDANAILLLNALLSGTPLARISAKGSTQQFASSDIQHGLEEPQILTGLQLPVWPVLHVPS